jgi:hypothetical protein
LEGSLEASFQVYHKPKHTHTHTHTQREREREREREKEHQSFQRSSSSLSHVNYMFYLVNQTQNSTAQLLAR